MGWCGCRRLDTSHGSEGSRCNDRWRFSRRQEFDAVLRSAVERTHLSSAQRSAHQRSPTQSPPPIPLPSLPDAPREIWGQLRLKIKYKWTRTRWSNHHKMHKTSSRHRRIHGRDMSAQQRSIIIADGSTFSRSVGLRSSFILSSCLSMGAWRMEQG